MNAQRAPADDGTAWREEVEPDEPALETRPGGVGPVRLAARRRILLEDAHRGLLPAAGRPDERDGQVELTRHVVHAHLTPTPARGRCRALRPRWPSA